MDGTGSGTTGVAIFDYLPMHAKTGIASRRPKSTLWHHRPGRKARCRNIASQSSFLVLSNAILGAAVRRSHGRLVKSARRYLVVVCVRTEILI
jgi:hypothetical protein